MNSSRQRKRWKTSRSCRKLSGAKGRSTPSGESRGESICHLDCRVLKSEGSEREKNADEDEEVERERSVQSPPQELIANVFRRVKSCALELTAEKLFSFDG